MAFVNGHQLEQVMEADNVNSKTCKKLLIVDSRPYISYNEEHITGACNMYCPPILKRRFANGGQVHLESMLGVETKNRLIAGQFSTIVVYDQEGDCLPILNTLNNNGPSSGIDISDLNIVYQTLCKIAKDAKCLILKGKFEFINILYMFLLFLFQIQCRIPWNIYFVRQHQYIKYTINYIRDILSTIPDYINFG